MAPGILIIISLIIVLETLITLQAPKILYGTLIISHAQRHYHIADTQDTTDTTRRHQYPVKFLQVILPSMEKFAYIQSILNPI